LRGGVHGFDGAGRVDGGGVDEVSNPMVVAKRVDPCFTAARVLASVLNDVFRLGRGCRQLIRELRGCLIQLDFDIVRISYVVLAFVGRGGDFDFLLGGCCACCFGKFDLFFRFVLWIYDTLAFEI